MSDVQNVMETLVEEQLDKCIASSGGCNCEFCRADIKALALNNLPPRYASRLQGSIITRADNMRNQASTDVLAAVLEAIKVVQANPRHDAVK